MVRVSSFRIFLLLSGTVRPSAEKMSHARLNFIILLQTVFQNVQRGYVLFDVSNLKILIS